VEASKIATRAMTEAFEKTGALPSEPPVFTASGIALYTDAQNADSLRKLGAGPSLESWFKAHFARRAAGDYIALLAYLDATETRLQALQNVRGSIRDKRGSRPACNSARGFCIRPDRPTRTGRIAACFFSSRRSLLPTSLYRAAPQASA